MSRFTEKEAEYIGSQFLCRLATVSADYEPEVSPVVFEFTGSEFYIGSLIMKKTWRYKNILAGMTKVCIAFDDIAEGDSPEYRGVKVYGIAELVEKQRPSGAETSIKVSPTRHFSWGIEGRTFVEGEVVFHRTKW